MPLTPRRILAAATLSAALALTAACGSDPEPAELSATEHNEADVAFASDMLQHHAQALSMVDLTRGRPLEPEVEQLVEQLVEQIRDAQAPEIETFTDWLLEWGEEVPPTMRDHVNAGHGSHDVSESMAGLDHQDMPGMLSADDFAELEDAPDADFQELWLGLMVEHHNGAVEMARDHADEGRYRPTVELAEQIADSQTEEIERMEDLLPASDD